MIPVQDDNNYSLVDVHDSVASHNDFDTWWDFNTNQQIIESVVPKTLEGCFSYANSAYFDSDYNNNNYAPANSLKRFRNYREAVPNMTLFIGTEVVTPVYGYNYQRRLVLEDPQSYTDLVYNAASQQIFISYSKPNVPNNANWGSGTVHVNLYAKTLESGREMIMSSWVLRRVSAAGTILQSYSNSTQYYVGNAGMEINLTFSCSWNSGNAGDRLSFVFGIQPGNPGTNPVTLRLSAGLYSEVYSGIYTPITRYKV